MTFYQHVITDAELHHARQCVVRGCKRTRIARGMCGRHYQRAVRGAPLHDPVVQDLPGEKWRQIVGYESRYSVSNMGRVRRDASTDGSCPARLLAPVRINGYVTAHLFDAKGRDRVKKVHRLVMAAFVGPARGLQVNHKDFDKTNNRLENLEYVTPRANIRHAVLGGRFPPQHGAHNPGSKLDDAKVREIRRLHATGRYRHRDLADMFGVSRPNISMIVNRRAWTHVQEAA